MSLKLLVYGEEWLKRLVKVTGCTLDFLFVDNAAMQIILNQDNLMLF
jgi:hypothetical protein